MLSIHRCTGSRMCLSIQMYSIQSTHDICPTMEGQLSCKWHLSRYVYEGYCVQGDELLVQIIGIHLCSQITFAMSLQLYASATHLCLVSRKVFIFIFIIVTQTINTSSTCFSFLPFSCFHLYTPFTKHYLYFSLLSLSSSNIETKIHDNSRSDNINIAIFFDLERYSPCSFNEEQLNMECR